MTSWWLAVRYFGSLKRFFNLSTSLAVLGMMIGVASLVVSMAVFTGYATTLESTVQDAVGHMLVVKKGAADQSQIFDDIGPMVKGLVAKTPFVYTDAILAHKGKISGVLIEGVDMATVRSVLRLENRVIEGGFDLAAREGDEEPRVMIGKGIAEKFGLRVGDVIRIVLPLANEFQASSFRPKLGRFRVVGVVSFGRHDFDTRYVIMPIDAVQAFAELGQKVTGYRLRLEDPARAREFSQAIMDKFGSAYWSSNWQEVNRNLFEAAKLEKALLFLVLMILVVVAAFNIANTLFVSVVQRYRDISVLKTLGAPDSLIRWIFTAQGLIVGFVGSVSGVVAGLILCQIVEWAQSRYHLVPAEIYKLDHINLDVQLGDLLVIVLASMTICFLATLIPSRRGARISPVEGLRYE